MEKYNFCDELKYTLFINELNSKTLEYRLNGFIYALKMNLEDGIYRPIVNTSSHNYTIKRKEDTYLIKISVMDTHNNKHNRVFKLCGNYNNLEFEFINQYNNSINCGRIKNIPFKAFVKIKENDDVYQLLIESVTKEQVYIKLDKSKSVDHESYSFGVNIMDFSQVLKLIKSFVNNPLVVYDTYKNIICNGKVILKSGELGSAYENDENLNQPLGKVMKRIKLL